MLFITLFGGREFQSLGAMTERDHLPRDVRTYGMNRTDESDDLIERESEKEKRDYCKDR